MAMVSAALYAPISGATSRALLVGVSSYPRLDSSKQLEGPKNDVLLIRRVLGDRGFESARIRTLADQVPGAALPTRRAILAELDRLVQVSTRGDFAFVYFAGHGSQVPVRPGDPHAADEPDGLHEIFLPHDIARWVDGKSEVENAILDYELVERLDAMRRNGVFVWAVFDACHSTTLMRSGDPAVRYRDVSPESLGIPRARIDEAVAQAARQPRSKTATNARNQTAGSPSAQGGYVAFYAAQTTERTPEERLPAGSSEQKPYGLFGWVLADAIGSLQGVSYRQLGQFVLHRYAAMNRSMPTPQFTGTHLDAPIFGIRVGKMVQQWPIDTRRGFQIRAGQVNQLAQGHILALVARPTDRTQDALGFVRVTAADIGSSRLEPIAHQGKAALAVGDIPRGSFARVFRQDLAFVLRIVRAPAGATAADLAVARQIERIERDGLGSIRVRFVAANEAYDLALRVEAGKLWLIPRGGLRHKVSQSESDPRHSIRIEQTDFGPKLDDSLRRIGKALNLLRLTEKAAVTETGVGLSLAGMTLRRGNAVSGIDPLSRPVFVRDDLVSLRLRNDGRVPIDLSALYLDAGYGIGCIYPNSGENNRLHPGNEATVDLLINDDTKGLERLVLIALEARANGERADLCWRLAQPTLARVRGESGTDAQTAEAFAAAGFGPGSDAEMLRGGSGVPVPARLGMKALLFEIK
ncbi:MAG: caspase family protein [Burkholderiaceae bacterium]|nr:caspase family protein [Burkholderiaceae bacterium]